MCLDKIINACTRSDSNDVFLGISFGEKHVDRLPARDPHREKRPYRQLVPLYAGLELIEDRIDNLCQGGRRLEPSFCPGNNWNDLHFYYIFVKYTIYRGLY